MTSCTDTSTKFEELLGDVRIEYSDCTGCLECIEDFSCPKNAIKQDPRTHRAYIDMNACVNCMLCINGFDCPEETIVIHKDVIPPAEIDSFTLTSDSVGKLDIEFTAPGDDAGSGLSHRYDLEFKNMLGEGISVDFTPDLPSEAGTLEHYSIFDLPQYDSIIVSIQAFDEMNASNEKVMRSVKIMGVHIDSIPPAAISDLSITSSPNSLKLKWTAPRNDGLDGNASEYIVKIYDFAITEDNFNSASSISNDLTPSGSGNIDSLTITDITYNTDHHFAIKTIDNFGNISEISNSVSGLMTGDIIPPSNITDLGIHSISSSSIGIKWTAPGDDENSGSADSYIIKVSNSEITDSNWESIDEYPNTLSPATAGSSENFFITDLEHLTEYFIGIISLDDWGNLSLLSNIISATTTDIPDITPPSNTTDLSITPTVDTIILEWTAPGDDGNIGNAMEYIIKMSESEITDTNFDSALTLNNIPTPSIPRTVESFEIEGLSENKTYFFALKSYDDVGNPSQLSNSVSGSIIGDIIPPAPIVDLVVSEGYVTSSTSMTLTWTATGDDDSAGTASNYEIRYSTSAITESNWSSASIVNAPPAPQVSGSSESFTVTGLNKGVIYYFGVKVIDESENYSTVSNSSSGKVVYQVQSACYGCGRCVSACSQGAITMMGDAVINVSRCNACGSCVSRCPVNAIKLYVISY